MDIRCVKNRDASHNANLNQEIKSTKRNEGALSGHRERDGDKNEG